VQHAAESSVSVEPDVSHRLVETGDRPAVHLVVRAVPAVDPHDRGLVSIAVGVGCRTSEGLGPVCSEPFAVLRMESMAERVPDDLVGHHLGVPRLGQTEQAVAAARCLIHALHVPRVPWHARVV
jgi:hypothetical protein